MFRLSCISALKLKKSHSNIKSGSLLRQLSLKISFPIILLAEEIFVSFYHNQDIKKYHKHGKDYHAPNRNL